MMPVITTRVASNNQNVRYYSTVGDSTITGTVSYPQRELSMYNWGSTVEFYAARFTPAIPKFCTINSATVTFRVSPDFPTSSSAGHTVNIRVWDSDDAPNLVTGTTYTARSNFILTTNKVGTTVWTPGSWAVNELKETVNFGSQIQTIINKPGWNSLNAISIYFIANDISPSTQSVWNALAYPQDGSGGDPDEAPLLTIDYTPADGFKHLDVKDGFIKEVDVASGNYLIRHSSGGYQRKAGLETTGALILDNGIIKEKA